MSTFIMLILCLLSVASILPVEAMSFHKARLKQEYEGKDFIVAFFPNYVSMYGRSVSGHLFIYSRSFGSCTVIDDDGKAHGVNIAADNITQFDLPGGRFYNLGTYVQKRGNRISCSVPVRMYGLSTRDNENGAATAYYMLPVTSQETSQYIVSSFPNNALIGIVATYDNTTVVVDIKSNCPLSGDNNLHDTKTLFSRDVYQIGSDMSGKGVNCDLGGTRITSSKPVALYSGASILVYPGQHGDHIVNQVKPVRSWGREYIVPMVFNMDQYSIRVVASQNNTKIKIESGDTDVVVLNESQVHQQNYIPNKNVFLSSTNPIQVSQIAGNDAQYDAFSSIVPSTDEYSTSFIVPDMQAAGRHFQRYITVITDTKCVSQIGVKSNWTSFVADNRHFSVALFQADDSVTKINSNSSNCRFAVQVTGFAQYEAYAYFATPS